MWRTGEGDRYFTDIRNGDDNDNHESSGDDDDDDDSYD
jgi:hypothetical protein